MRAPVKESGFTLVEVLAALMIFSLSIIGLTHAGTETVKTASYLEQKILAGVVADNQLSLARISESSGRTKRGTERQMAQEFEYEVVRNTTDVDGFYTLTVTVKSTLSDQNLVVRTAYVASQ